VKREDLFLVSKLWNSFHDKERVQPIVKKQLADWGIDYFDLYYIHFPIAIEYVDPSVRYPPGWYSGADEKEIRPGKSTLQETWQEMEKLVDAGLAKGIAVSNYDGKLLLDMQKYAKIMPATLQVEHHPYYVQPYLQKLADQLGIAMVGYSSFGPQSFVDCDMELAKGIPLLFDNEVITKIAKSHDKTPAQILLRWATQRGISVIPKSATPSRLASNLDVTSFDLTDAELKEISSLDRNLRFNNPPNVSVY
jgi:D-xylose reductase